jgi:hypothetical protein
MYLAQLHIGGLVAVGVDPTGRYLLTVSHAGRGLFDSLTWQRVARDLELAYPIDGHAIGIGPLSGQRIPVVEVDYNRSTMNGNIVGNLMISYEDGLLTVESSGTQQ